MSRMWEDEMTEEDAKKKWCPMVRFGGSACNTDSQTPRDTTLYGCIASNCMMWQYKEYDYVIPENVPPSGKGTLEGYCGLAR